MSRLRLALILVVLAAWGGQASAQSWGGGQGRLDGLIKNEKGVPIEGATVVLRWEDGTGPADIKTNKKGRWAILGLQGGRWEIDISAPGYQTKKVTFGVSQIERAPTMEVELQPEVKQAPAEPQISIGGKKISKEMADAIEAANAAWGQADKALDDEDNCSKAPAPGQESAGAQKACADAAEQKRQAALKDSLAHYEQVIGELSDNIPILTRLEIGYYWLKNVDGALKYAKVMTQADPSDTTSWLMIAELSLQKGDMAGGKDALAKVPDDKIGDPQPYMNMGILYYNKNMPVEAGEYFSKAIAKKADAAEAYYYRGLARYQQAASIKDKEGAAAKRAESKADFQKYLEIAPNGNDAETVKELLKSFSETPRAKKRSS